MRQAVLFLMAGGLAVASSGAANAQDSHAPAGGVDSRDVMAANRDRDAAYNTLSSRGVKTTDKDRENARSKRGSPVPATAEDIKPGAQVRDVKGVPIGSIAALSSNEIMADPSQPVIDTGQAKIGVPLNAFGKDDKGLLLSITADKFNQLLAQVQAKKPAAEPKSN